MSPLFNLQKNSVTNFFRTIWKEVTIPIASVLFMIPEFSHKAPKGYSYEYEQFKRNLIAIWIRNSHTFDYNLGKSVRSIWGFYDSKKRVYHAPINSSTVGNVVSIEDTTPYSAMIPKLTPLESAFV
jgi:hypothetical protein